MEKKQHHGKGAGQWLCLHRMYVCRVEPDGKEHAAAG